MKVRTTTGMPAFMHNDGGASAIEFALVLPILLALVFGTIEFGRFMWVRTSLQGAVEVTARCSALNNANCETAALARDFAARSSAGVNVSPSAFTVSTAPCGAIVSASYPFNSLVPFVPINPTISVSACHKMGA